MVVKTYQAVVYCLQMLHHKIIVRTVFLLALITMVITGLNQFLSSQVDLSTNATPCSLSCVSHLLPTSPGVKADSGKIEKDKEPSPPSYIAFTNRIFSGSLFSTIVVIFMFWLSLRSKVLLTTHYKS